MSVLSSIVAESIHHKFIADILQYMAMDEQCDDRTRDRVFHAAAELLRVRLEGESPGECRVNYAGSGYGIDDFGDKELLEFFLRDDF